MVVVLNYVLMEHGVLSVVTFGTTLMLVLSVDNLDTPPMVYKCDLICEWNYFC